MNLRNKKAFSLIELSIVILIIGIIVAGVTQSSRLISAFKLSTARNLTQSSPIYSIRDLVMWYEATTDPSFTDSEEDNGLAVSTWYDINPFSQIKYNLTQTSTNRPTYTSSAINGIPALYFDGSNDSMVLSPEYTLSTTQTIFVVFKPTLSSGNGEIISTTSNSGGRYQVIRYLGGSSQLYTWNGASYTGSITASTNAMVVTFTQNGASMQYYSNGTALTAGSANNEAMKFSQVGALDVTIQNPFSGYISEIIFYERVLKTEERQAIERYLGKKWGISVS